MWRVSLSRLQYLKAKRADSPRPSPQGNESAPQGPREAKQVGLTRPLSSPQGDESVPQGPREAEPVGLTRPGPHPKAMSQPRKGPEKQSQWG